MPEAVSHLFAHFAWTRVLVGLVVGFFVGLTGVGGGVILAPILIYLGIQPSVAVGTDLVYGSITKLVGTWRNVQAKRVDWRWVRALAVGSIPAGVAGSYLIDWLRHTQPEAEPIVKMALGAVLTFAAAVNIGSEFFIRGKKRAQLADWTPRDARTRIVVASAGALIGFMVGLTSVGSGSLFALLLLFTSRLEMPTLVGTDIAHAMLLVAAASLAHIDIGTVDYGLAVNLLMGSIPGVLIGGRLVGILPARALKVGVCALVLVAGVKMLGP
jgi:uncharacterized membrane protein YfcA